MLFSIFFFSLAANAFVIPGAVQNSGGMPISFTPPEHRDVTIEFRWDKKKIYERKIRARATGSGENSRRFVALPENPQEVSGLALSPLVVRALEQVRKGGNKFRIDDSPEEFLKNNPIEKFDHQTNQNLTWDYGPEFTAQVYKFIRDHRPENIFAKNKLIEMIANPEMTKALILKNFQNIKVLIVRGYIQGKTDERTQKLYMLLKNSGIDADFIETDTAGPVLPNQQKIAAELFQRLKEGQHLIVCGLSKSVPELLGAVSTLSSQLPLLPGKIEALLSLSGVIGGSFFADWASHGLQYEVARLALHHEAVGKGVKAEGIGQGLRELSTEFMQKYYSEIKSNLPQDIMYVEVSGVRTDDFGLAPDPHLRSLQTNFYQSPLFQRFSANDGFVEYPGTEIPHEWVKNLFQITLNSSHEIDDGSFEGQSLRDPGSYEAVIRSIFAFVGLTFNR